MLKNTTNSSVYGVYDSVGDQFAVVFIAPNDEFAERQFFNLITSPDSTVFALNFNDFKLVKFTSDHEILRAATDYSETIIRKARHDRVMQFADNAVKPEDLNVEQ